MSYTLYFQEKKLVMNDQTLHTAIMRVKGKLQDHNAHKQILFRIRDDLTLAVSSCADNVEVIIYLDDVLDDPINIIVGAGDNRLRITIQTDGKVTARWTDETWGKIFNDVGTVINNLMKSVIKSIKGTSVIGDVEAIDAIKKGAIKN